MAGTPSIVLVDRIEPMIQTIRGQQVILDRDLANLYRVPTKRLNEQVRRNRQRFPGDFMFHLTEEEAAALRLQNPTGPAGALGMRSQNATASKRNVRFRPFVFTEHGAIMAASILNSPTAVEVSVYVVRAFVKLRELVLTHKDLVRKLDSLEKRYDAQFKVVFEAIRQLMGPPPETRRGKIGFGRQDEK